MLFTIQLGVDKMKEETAKNINPSSKAKKYSKKAKCDISYTKAFNGQKY